MEHGNPLFQERRLLSRFFANRQERREQREERKEARADRRDARTNAEQSIQKFTKASQSYERRAARFPRLRAAFQNIRSTHQTRLEQNRRSVDAHCDRARTIVKPDTSTLDRPHVAPAPPIVGPKIAPTRAPTKPVAPQSSLEEGSHRIDTHNIMDALLPAIEFIQTPLKDVVAYCKEQWNCDACEIDNTYEDIPITLPNAQRTGRSLSDAINKQLDSQHLDFSLKLEKRTASGETKKILVAVLQKRELQVPPPSPAPAIPSSPSAPEKSAAPPAAAPDSAPPNIYNIDEFFPDQAPQKPSSQPSAIPNESERIPSMPKSSDSSTPDSVLQQTPAPAADAPTRPAAPDATSASEKPEADINNIMNVLGTLSQEELAQATAGQKDPFADSPSPAASSPAADPF